MGITEGKHGCFDEEKHEYIIIRPAEVWLVEVKM